MTTRILLAGLAARSLLAARGGETRASSGASDGTRGIDAKAKKAMLNYAKCMREHGIDMPDPQFDGGGVRMTQGQGVDPDKARAAEDARRHFQEEVKAPAISEEQQTEMRKRALANSKCMRDHGFNMPDPQFDDNGRVTMRIDRKSGID